MLTELNLLWIPTILLPLSLPVVTTVLFSITEDTSQQMPSDIVNLSANYYTAIYWEFQSFPKLIQPLQYKWCGGVIIDKHHVLSAAHCYKQYVDFISRFSTFPPLGARWEMWVYFGNFSRTLRSFDKEVFGQNLNKFPVQSISSPEEFIYNETNILDDIAILRVQESFDQENILPICRAQNLTKNNKNNKNNNNNNNNSNNNKTNKTLVVTGIGKGRTKEFPEKLRSVKVTEDLTGYCDSVDDTTPEPGKFLCVRGWSACYGDSGGPLALLDLKTETPSCVYGVVSHLVGVNVRENLDKLQKEGEEKSICVLAQGVRYTNVSHFADWIDAKIRVD